MHWLDLGLLLIAALAMVNGFRKGLLRQAIELVVLLAAIYVSLAYYKDLADWLISRYHTSILLAKPGAFLALWFGVEMLATMILNIVYHFVPGLIKDSVINRLLGSVLGLAKALIFVATILAIVVSLPFGGSFKQQLAGSRTAQPLIQLGEIGTHALERSLGHPLAESFNFLTTSEEPNSESLTKIPAVLNAAKLKSEPELEAKMLSLINQERSRAGLPALVADDALRDVGRAHSRDMWLRGYFAHVDPDGHDPFDRMRAAGIRYTAAGENLALAPTLDIAHIGLMRSPAHRANILSKNYGRVGIGIISAGADGLMISQEFRD